MNDENKIDMTRCDQYYGKIGNYYYAKHSICGTPKMCRSIDGKLWEDLDDEPQPQPFPPSVPQKDVRKPNKDVRKPNVWERVAKGEIYWYIQVDGSIQDIVEKHNCSHNGMYDFGNYFQTVAEAVYYRDLWQLQAEIRRWKWEHDGAELDWDDWSTKKYHIMFEHMCKELIITDFNFCETIFTPYFSTRELAQECIEVFRSRIIDCIKKGRDFE